MPYSMKNIPATVKNLSKPIQKIFIETFNAVYEDTKDESAARQAAWANVKKKYTKVGDKWVRKQSESTEPEEADKDTENEEDETVEDEPTEDSEQEESESVNDEIVLGSPLSEAVFNDESKTAVVTIIREGWSANYTDGRQRYYTAKAVSDVAELLGTSRKMFLDHSAKERSVSEWTATSKRSWTEKVDGKNCCKAEIDFTENPKTVWLYAEAKKHPQEVALSIQGAGEIRAGKKEEKNASIVESITKLRSTDFVTVAAAGGKVEKTLSASADTERALFVLNEAFLTIDQIISNIEKTEQPYIEYERTLSALREFLSNLIWTSEVMDGDVTPSIEDALNSFSGKIKEAIQKIRINKLEKDGEEESEEDENEESVKNKEIPMTLEELKTNHPEAYNALMQEVKESVNKEVKEAEEKAEADKAALVAEKEDIEKKLQEAETELGKFKEEKALVEKKERIETKLTEAKISEKVSEEFKGLLLTLEEEVADKLIADKVETLTVKTAKVEGFGPAGKKEEKDVKDFKSLWFKKN